MDERDIRALTAVEAVRKRPGMYIGDCHDRSGLNHMVLELVANVVDLHLVGACSRLEATAHADGRLTVADDGPGMPMERTYGAGTFLDIVLTTIHRGATLDGHGKHVHLGLHGVGIAPVNFLSRSFVVEVDRAGKRYRQEYREGVAVAPLASVGETAATGTRITFEPDPTIFDPVDFDGDRLRDALREVAFLNAGLAVTFVDERAPRPFPGGVVEFATQIARRRGVLPERPIHAHGEENGVSVDAALSFDKFDARGDLRSYANQSRTSAGTHVEGLRRALAVLVEALPEDERDARQNELFNRLVGVISVTHFDPSFDGPTRAVLENPDVTPVVERVVAAALRESLPAWAHLLEFVRLRATSESR